MVWNFPHNPTGALPPAGDFTRMVEAVAATGAWLFSDEMYRLLEPAPEVRLPPAVDIYERAVSLAGMSKAYGLAGLRIGWVAARDREILERMTALKDYTTICSSAPSEVLALMALHADKAILAGVNARLASNVETATRFFVRHSLLFEWAPPQAGSVCFPRLQVTAGIIRGSEAFCAALLERTGILLLPSTVFGYGDRHVRLGLGRDDLRQALELFDEYLGDRRDPGADAPD